MFDKRIQRPSDREGRFFTLRGNIFAFIASGEAGLVLISGEVMIVKRGREAYKKPRVRARSIRARTRGYKKLR